MKGKTHKLFSLVMALVMVASLCAIVAVPAAAITAGNVNCVNTPTTAGASAQYTITFDHTAVAPIGTVISITFPAGVTVPSTIPYTYVRQGAGATAAAATAAEATYTAADPAPIVEGQTVRVSLKAPIAAGQFGSITFSQLAGIKNPPLADATGNLYRVTVTSSVVGELAAQQAAGAGFAVTRLVTFSPSRGPVGTAITVTGVGFAPNSSIDITDAAGTLIGSGTTNADGSFNVTAYAAATSATVLTATDGAGNATPSAAAFVLTPKMVVEPTSGIVGKTFQVTATGLTPGNLYCFGWKNTPIDVVAATTGTILSPGITALIPAIDGVIADPAGKIVCTINVPAGETAGAKILDIRLSDAVPPTTAFTGLAAFNAAAQQTTTTFEVTTRSITLSPATGPAGTTVTITGEGFSAFAGAAGSGIASVPAIGGLVSPTFTTNSEGAFTTSVTIPVGTPAGTYAITATDGNGNAATANFVIPAPLPRAISLSPDSGPVGTAVTVTGSNFKALSTVTATFTTPAPAVQSIVATGSTDSAGGCVLTFNVPASAVGFANVTVTDATGQAAPAKTFTVTAGAVVVTVSDGLNSIAGKYSKVWTFDAPTQSWKLYDTAAPQVSDLSSLTKGQGYWMEVSENCTLTYGVNSYSLVKGWNLIGWLG